MSRNTPTIHTVELSRGQYRRYQELVAEHTAPLLKFASVRFANEASNSLRRPYGRAEWLALTSAERSRNIKSVGRTRAKAALARELAPMRAHLKERVVPPRYVVACSCSCGSQLPARGPLPVVMYAEGHRRSRRRDFSEAATSRIGA
jgi:hypothetical protein